MKVSEISEPPPLQYGDKVKVKGKDSMYSNLVGKIVDITSISAKVKFEGTNKTVLIMLDALERV